MLKTLREKAGQKAANQAVLEVNLHHFRRIAAIGQAQRFESDSADWDPLAPFIDPFAALAWTGP